MPETSAGAISLDLTIQDKLTEQIERSISSARKYAESLGRELENSITAPIKRAADKVKTIDVPVSVKTEDIAGKLHETMENAKEALNIPVDVKAENVAQKVHDITEQAQTVITIPVDIEPESAFRAVEEKMSSIAESIREKLGAVDFPTASAERFTGQLEVMTEKLALPTLIALCSIALGKPTLSSLAVLGEISIAGTMLKVDELANALQVCLDSGAKKVLLPITSAADLGLVPADLIGCFNLVFYQSAEDAVYKALGVE